MTELLFRDDPYLRQCEAKVIEINERGGIIIDRSVFYATSGGQPGDSGQLRRPGGSEMKVSTTVYGENPEEIVLVPNESPGDLKAGDDITTLLDWERRHRHMRMHTALHLLCSLVPFPVTGGSIGEAESRLDFDIESADAVDKDDLSGKLQDLVGADHPVSWQWISDAELDANPGLVRTMSAAPPRNAGQVRLVGIGDEGAIDLQPCGGTHVRSTGEIGEIQVSKIEKKGRQNRRIRVRFADGT